MFKWLVKRLPWRGKEVVAKLEQAGADASKECAGYIVGRAAALAPVKTGRLKRSIRSIPTLGGRQWNVIVEVPYAFWVEYGFIHYKSGKWIPPNPFFRRAMDDARRVYPGLLKKAVVTKIGNDSKHLGTTFRSL
jgi:hypothetical protein